MAFSDLLTHLPALTAALVALIAAIKGHRRGQRSTAQIETLESKINGRLEQLLDATRESARLEGYADALREQLQAAPPAPPRPDTP